MSINRNSSVLLLGVLIILPFLMVTGGSYFDGAHPLESRLITEDTFLSESMNQVEVVFFGFVGCSSVCPVSLIKLAEVLESEALQHSGIKAGGTFVEVDLSGRTGKKHAEHFSALFSGNIRGVHPGKDKLDPILRDFAARVTNNRHKEGLITHTDYFYILNHTDYGWMISAVLGNDSSQQDLLDAILCTSEKVNT